MQLMMKMMMTITVTMATKTPMVLVQRRHLATTTISTDQLIRAIFHGQVTYSTTNCSAVGPTVVFMKL